ncbi:MAG: hypothetical protein AW07_01589 [Candidatus Accumulibacter sp. SK-11]|nr:MAG: hypothetical protein AW07_01589 [Candidatus Accumulibacter sp. SK-11]
MQALRHLDQQRVAHPVTQSVVDALEAIEINEHHGQRLATAMRTREFMPDPLVQQAAVGQTGQRIDVRQAPDARLRLLVPADVDEAGDIVRRHAFRVDAADRQPFRIQATVPAPVPDLALPVPECFDRRPDALLKLGSVLRGEEESDLTTERLGRAVAGNPRKGLVGPDDAPAAVDDRDAPRRVREEPSGKIKAGARLHRPARRGRRFRQAAWHEPANCDRACAWPDRVAPLLRA